jgi:hypothetical protein
LHARRCTNQPPHSHRRNTSPHWFARQLDGQEARHRTPCRLRHRLLALIWLHRSSFDQSLAPRQATPTQWHPCSSPTPVQGSIGVPCTHCANHGRRPFTTTECRRCATTQPPTTHQHQLKHCPAQLRCMRIALLQALSARQTPPSSVLSTLASLTALWPQIASSTLTFLRDVFGPSSKKILSARNAHHCRGVVGVQPPPGPARHPSRHIHCLSTCLIHPARVAAARAHARGTQPNNTHSTAKLKVAESPSTFCLFHFGCRFRRPSGPRTACFNSLWRHPAATRCVRFSLYHANIRYMITLHLVFIAECDSFRLLTVDNPQLCTRKA